MPPNSLSDNIRRTSENLKKGATRQVTDYENRFSVLDNLYDELLADLIKTAFDQNEACKTAKEFFGSKSVKFAAVDGTLYSRPLFDMVIFFGGAYAATGTLSFSEKNKPKVEYDQQTMHENMGISSVVPLYANEIPDVDLTYSAPEQPDEINPAKLMKDEDITNNSLIANNIMTLSEYYLAYKLATDSKQDLGIIFMDRSLSAERASLLYETRKTDFWNAKSAILGYKVESHDIPIDKNDLSIARQHVLNPALGVPPPRADYLRYALVCLAQEKEKFTAEQIFSNLGIENGKRKDRVKHALKILTKKDILKEIDGNYRLVQRYSSSWERIRKITLEIGEKLFSKRQEESETKSPMKIIKNGKEHWLTTLDIGFLTLFTLQMLMEECWRKPILLVGITKDTAARDFKRQLIPLMEKEKLLKNQNRTALFRNLPNTDRMILQSASLFNNEKMKPPWSLIEYDSCFRTILPDKKNRGGYVSGIIKNKISLEKTFLKTYIQLSQAKTDPMLRSNVLLIDRLAYPKYDCKPKSIFKFWNQLSDGTVEPVETILYTSRDLPNILQNLVLSILIAMAPTNIPEAFGHNKALFIADKIAKWNYSQFKGVVDTTASWILNSHKLRKFIFYMSSFRERRERIEQTRRENR